MAKYVNGFLKVVRHSENDSNNQIHLDKGSREYEEMIRDHRDIPETEQEYMKKDIYRKGRDLVCTDPFYPTNYKKRSKKEKYFLKRMEEYMEGNHEKIHAIVDREKVKNTNQKINNVDNIEKSAKKDKKIKKELQIQDTDYVYDSDIDELNKKFADVEKEQIENEKDFSYSNKEYY